MHLQVLSFFIFYYFSKLISTPTIKRLRGSSHWGNHVKLCSSSLSFYHNSILSLFCFYEMGAKKLTHSFILFMICIVFFRWLIPPQLSWFKRKKERRDKKSYIHFLSLYFRFNVMIWKIRIAEPSLRFTEWEVGVDFSHICC